MDATSPLHGFRIGVTAARKVEEQVGLLERRGATVSWAPALSTAPNRVDEADLRAATERVLATPVDLFVATTGIGVRAWFERAEAWGLLDDLLAALGRAEVLARGPKSVGALRRHGLREAFTPDSERLDDVLAHLAGRDLHGRRVVVQEHGQSLSAAADRLRARGAEVQTVAVYRIAAAEDTAPLSRLVDAVAARDLDAVTFTSAPAVAALMGLAGATGRGAAVAEAFRDGVLAACVGPVTAEAFEAYDVPTVHPDRSRLGAMVRQVEAVLAAGRR